MSNTIISANDVLSKAPLGFNYDIGKITPHIFRAEQKHIRPFLGKDYYDSLVTEANGSAGTNLTGDDATFWNLYLHELCAFACIYEGLVFGWLTISNKGIMKNNAASQGGESANASEVSLLRTSYHDAIKSLQESADCWLKEQYCESAKYPLYVGNEAGMDKRGRQIINPLGILGIDPSVQSDTEDYFDFLKNY